MVDQREEVPTSSCDIDLFRIVRAKNLNEDSHDSSIILDHTNGLSSRGFPIIDLVKRSSSLSTTETIDSKDYDTINSHYCYLEREKYDGEEDDIILRARREPVEIQKVRRKIRSKKDYEMNLFSDIVKHVKKRVVGSCGNSLKSSKGETIILLD
eukprot:CAMPEP_0178946858 /NCGR_PEP_ID=MMETSP0789-20121207/4518_1 /TAXON_ID=3005 /ORGANISM="Rhizosolenia setigera, Strain CCMP 1694" /LENGTH=153 /DNA_ID=CAMNT_0020626895 /DNA_START=9 /DNA_END=470 /DNA_ORIENTATION=+